MDSTSRRFQRVETKPEVEMKGILVMMICYFYAILVFFLAAMLVNLTGSTKKQVLEKLRRYQFWKVEREKKVELPTEKYDINHNVYNKKNVNVGWK